MLFIIKCLCFPHIVFGNFYESIGYSNPSIVPYV